MLRLDHGKLDHKPETLQSKLRQQVVEACLEDMGFQSAVLEERARGRKAKVCMLGVASNEAGLMLVNVLTEKPYNAPGPIDENSWAWHLFETKKDAMDFLNGACPDSVLDADSKHMLFIVGGWDGWAYFLVDEAGISKIVDPTVGSGTLPWAKIGEQCGKGR